MFGVWSSATPTTDTEVAKLTYFGLYALQHRGQESAGIAVSNGSQILVYKDMGLVAQVFDEGHLNSLRGHLAIGHTRYSTTGASVWENAQPTFRSTAAGSIALGHNGNLTNTRELLDLVEKLAADSGQLPYDGSTPSQGETRRWREGVRSHTVMHSTTDTEIISALLASYPDLSLEQAAMRCCPSCAARSRWCSWTRARCTPRATRRASARWSSAGSSAAGSWPARPRRWTSSAPPRSARSSPAS